MMNNPDANPPVVIVGASLGGLRTAEALRRSGYLGNIDIIGEETYQPYNRPPLSKEVLAASVDHSAVAFPHDLSSTNTRWILGTRVVNADLTARKVTDEFGTDHPYSALIIATGLRPRRLNLENDDARGVHVLRTLFDAIWLRADLIPGAKVVIVGAGFIGCEVASTAIKLGCDVTVVAADEHPMVRPLGANFAAELQRRHESAGVTYLLNNSVNKIVTNTAGAQPILAGLELTDGQAIECDVLVQAIGSLTNTEWVANTSIDISNGVLTDGAMRALTTSGHVVPDVFAVGDVARFPNPIFGGAPRRIEHWNIPIETAKRVGQVLAAKLNDHETFEELVAQQFAPIPSFWSDQFGMNLLAFGDLGLATESRLIDGDIGGDCIWGYYKDGALVGVCGIGMRSALQSHRKSFLLQPPTATAVGK